MTHQKKAALVTGASKGIGYAIAKQLLNDGYNIVVTSRSADTAQTAAHILSAETGNHAVGLAYNMENPLLPSQLISTAIENFGRLDVLVNNALANVINAPLLDTEDPVIDTAIVANISSVIKLCKHAYPHLKKSNGNIINISSSITNRYVNSLPLYAMLKSSIEKLTSSLAADWCSDGIRLNAIRPGFTHSSAAKDLGLNPEQIEGLHHHLEQFQPLGITQPDDIASLVSYLVSDKARKITGAVLDIDGGHHIQGHALFPRL